MTGCTYVRRYLRTSMYVYIYVYIYIYIMYVRTYMYVRIRIRKRIFTIFILELFHNIYVCR